MLNENIETLVTKAKMLAKTQGIELSLAKKQTLECLILELYEKEGKQAPFRLTPKISVNFEEDIVELISRNLEEIVDVMYQTLVEKKQRSDTGQFFTPKEIATFMVKLGMESFLSKNKGKNNVEVLDPGTGLGAFAVSFYDYSKTHDFSVNFFAVDTDILLLDLTYLRLLKKGYKETDKFSLKLINKDFLTLTGLQVDIAIANPPYINFRQFDTQIVNRFAAKINITKLTNIYSLFMIKALEDLVDDGILVFITPHEFLFTDYGVTLKKHILEKTLDSVILFGYESKVFPEAITTPVITTIIKSNPDLSHRTGFVVISNFNANIPIELFNQDRNNGVRVRHINQVELDSSEKWLYLFDELQESSELGLIRNRSILVSKIGNVSRGIATGQNNFFLLSKDDKKKWKVADKYFRIALSRAKQCKYFDFTSEDIDKLIDQNEKMFLLYVTETNIDENLGHYLKYGEKLDVHKRFLTSHRSPWFKTEERKPPQILVTTFSRTTGFRFILNKAKIVPVASAFHGFYTRTECETDVKALLGYLNSNFAAQLFARNIRIHGLGLKKVEPRDIERMPIIDLSKIDQNCKIKLAEIFDNLCKISRENPKRIDIVKREADDLIKELM